MRNIYIILFLFILSCTEQLRTPLEEAKFEAFTSYDSMIEYLEKVEASSSLIELSYIGETENGFNIPLLEIRNEGKKDASVVTILMFAQQHGNEHGGKEGMLQLLKEIAGGSLDYLFDKIEMLLIPTLNPEGSETDERRNGNDLDLNRDHLLLSQPETAALHALYHKYTPEVSVDIHEYYPYSESWIDYGYLKSYDMQVGALTNPNLNSEIIDFSKSVVLPYLESSLSDNGYSFHEYLVGGPPDRRRLRYSTVDINDGRQSLGILGTLSFIFEGKNGRSSSENLKRRSEVQSTAQKAFLKFCFDEASEISELVNKVRRDLGDRSEGDSVTVRMEHVAGSISHNLILWSTFTESDTIITVSDFHTQIESEIKLSIPKGYLVPKESNKLIRFLTSHNIQFEEYFVEPHNRIRKYQFLSIDTLVNEELKNIYPEVRLSQLDSFEGKDYLYVPCSQLASLLIVTAFEPQSMLGLIQYPEVFPNVKRLDSFPILRVD
jgi:hypothetical protein